MTTDATTTPVITDAERQRQLFRARETIQSAADLLDQACEELEEAHHILDHAELDELMVFGVMQSNREVVNDLQGLLWQSTRAANELQWMLDPDNLDEAALMEARADQRECRKVTREVREAEVTRDDETPDKPEAPAA